MSLKFFTDSHIAKQVAIQLKSLNVEVVRCQDVGLDNAHDEELLVYAVNNDCVMLTKDDDFLSLHRKWQRINRDHWGIFYCAYRDRPAIGLIVTICKEYHDLIESGAGEKDDLKNEVVYIT